jgi:hypothetical protein
MAVLTCPFKLGASCDRILCSLWDVGHDSCAFLAMVEMLVDIDIRLGGAG